MRIVCQQIEKQIFKGKKSASRVDNARCVSYGSGHVVDKEERNRGDENDETDVWSNRVQEGWNME